MNIACNLQQSSIFGGNGCKRYKLVDAGAAKSRFKMSGLGYRHLGTASLGPRWCAVKNVRRNRHPDCLLSSKLCFGREVDSFWNSKPGNSVVSVSEMRARIPSPMLPANCQGNDSVYIDGSDRSIKRSEDVEKDGMEEGGSELESTGSGGQEGNETKQVPDLDDLRELLQKARRDLEVGHLNRNMFEG